MVLYQTRGMIPRIPKIPKIPVILIQNEIGQAPLFPASCDIHVSTGRIKSIVMVANIAKSNVLPLKLSQQHNLPFLFDQSPI